MNSSWWKMWIAPCGTITKVLQRNSKRDYYILAFLFGLPIVFQIEQATSLGRGMTAELLWVLALICATPIGLGAIWVVSWILFQVGKVLKGHAQKRQIQIAVAWSNLPIVVASFSWLVMSFIFGNNLFRVSFFEQNYSIAEQAVLLGLMVLQTMGYLWSFFLLIKTMGVVQKFSLQKAFVNVVVPYVIFVLWVVVVQ